jgi:hypothetical protein
MHVETGGTQAAEKRLRELTSEDIWSIIGSYAPESTSSVRLASRELNRLSRLMPISLNRRFTGQYIEASSHATDLCLVGRGSGVCLEVRSPAKRKKYSLPSSRQLILCLVCECLRIAN